MFAVIGFVAGVVAAILKLTNQHANAIIWLLIIGLIGVAVEALWGWHRGGYYRHGALMYIGLGAVLVIILIVVLIVFLIRR